MKKLLLNVPFFTLLIFSVYILYFGANISLAIIHVGLLALYGYQLYLESIKVTPPKMDEDTKKLMDDLNKLNLKRQYIQLQTAIARETSAQKGLNDGKSKEFLF